MPFDRYTFRLPFMKRSNSNIYVPNKRIYDTTATETFRWTRREEAKVEWLWEEKPKKKKKRVRRKKQKEWWADSFMVGGGLQDYFKAILDKYGYDSKQGPRMSLIVRSRSAGKTALQKTMGYPQIERAIAILEERKRQEQVEEYYRSMYGSTKQFIVVGMARIPILNWSIEKNYARLPVLGSVTKFEVASNIEQEELETVVKTVYDLSVKVPPGYISATNEALSVDGLQKVVKFPDVFGSASLICRVTSSEVRPDGEYVTFQGELLIKSDEDRVNDNERNRQRPVNVRVESTLTPEMIDEQLKAYKTDIQAMVAEGVKSSDITFQTMSSSPFFKRLDSDEKQRQFEKMKARAEEILQEQQRKIDEDYGGFPFIPPNKSMIENSKLFQQQLEGRWDIYEDSSPAETPKVEKKKPKRIPKAKQGAKRDLDF